MVFGLALLQYASFPPFIGTCLFSRIMIFFAQCIFLGQVFQTIFQAVFLQTVTASRFINALNCDVSIIVVSKALYKFAYSVKYHST